MFGLDTEECRVLHTLGETGDQINFFSICFYGPVDVWFGCRRGTDDQSHLFSICVVRSSVCLPIYTSVERREIFSFYTFPIVSQSVP
ncbi:hypothetical protein J6590_080662 [Homalodisca vitripennis]|nr:hypothetical protein J6590_080662 [Homalodisca vitripennis]